MSEFLFRGRFSERAGPDQRLDFSGPTEFDDYSSSSRPLPQLVTGSAASSEREKEHLEAEEEEPLGVEAPTSIYTLYHYCLLELNDLLVAIRNSQTDLDVDLEIHELRSRLQIWAGNHGAHRRQEDRLSLDYRLREAPELHKEVRDHFNDLINNLGEAIAAMTASEVGTELPLEEDSSSSSSSEGSLTASQKALIGMSSTPDPPNSKSRLQATRDSIDNVITSLYKFSITIQNPAHRDRTARAAKIDVSFWHEHDIRHVQDKFRSCSDRKLLQNLAQANTKRRQLFEYHKRHRNKIQHYQHADVQEVPAVLLTQLESTEDNVGQVAHLPAASTIRTGKTKLTMTTVSTINPLIRTIAPSVSVRSRRTNITTDTLSASNNALQIPSPPNHSGDFSELFICPYCFSTIDPTDKKSWEHHVLDDLRPYLCTFANCTSVPVLYERYSEWSTHELEVHRREWFCKFCKALYDTRDEFVEHLRLQHQNLVGNTGQVESLISFCERISTRDEDCSLCGDFTGKPHEVQEHLAHHLRQLALYTLPKLSNDATDENEAGTDIACLNNNDVAPSDNTQTEFLKIAMEEYEQECAIITPLDSPSLSIPDLDDPISWEHLQNFALSSPPESVEEEYQRLVKAFSIGEEDKSIAHIPGALYGTSHNRNYSPNVSHKQHRDTIRAIMFSYSRIQTAMGIYKEGFEPIAGWSRYRVEFDSFVEKVKSEEEILYTALYRLLPRGFHKQGTERFDGTSLFTASDTLQILEKRMENNWDSYMYCVDFVKTTLSEIKTMLSLNENGYISWEEQGMDKWYLQLVRVCQNLSRKGVSLYASLSQGTRRLQDLLVIVPTSVVEDQSQDKLPKTTKQPNHVPDNLAEVKQYASRLYTALQSSWICNCESTHRFLLELLDPKKVEIGIPRFHLGLVISSQARRSTGRLYKLDITFQPTEPESIPRISSLCAVLKASRRQGEHYYITYLGDDITGYCVVRFISNTQLLAGQQFDGLTDLLSHNRSTVPPAVKGLNDLGTHAASPYLEFNPVKVQERPLPKDQTSTWKETKVGQSMNNLGIMLLELVYGNTVEHGRTYTSHLIAGQSHEGTDLLTALDMVDDVAPEASVEMEEAIKRCLRCDFKEALNWDREAFVQEVYRLVIVPWQQSMADLGWNETEYVDS